MRAIDLYDMTPENKTFELDQFKNHFDEAPSNFFWMKENKNEEIEARIIKDMYIDGRRTWVLATMWFNGIPFMVTQNSGRDNDEYTTRFITNYKVFFQAILYLTLLVQDEQEWNENTKNIDTYEDIPALTEFYGTSLEQILTKEGKTKILEEINDRRLR